MNDQEPINQSEYEATIAAAHDALKKQHPLIGDKLIELTGRFAADSLESVDAQTRQLSDTLRGSSQNALQTARALGQAMWTMKLRIPEGHWTIWLENNSPYSPRRSQEFMQLARDWQVVEKAIRANPRYDIGNLSVEKALKIMRSAHDPAGKPMRRDEKQAGVSCVSRWLGPASGEKEDEEPLPNSKLGKFLQKMARGEMEELGPLTLGNEPDALVALHKCIGTALQQLIMAEIYYPPGGSENTRKILLFAIEELKCERASITRTLKDHTTIRSRQTHPSHQEEADRIAEADEQAIAATLERLKAGALAYGDLA